ncbi:MAG: hypothetical protein C7B46_13595 [Sulfobacillus benefaciens]|uniref:GGDEF domain-containing protein n=1 Tax=Sulfobacillus benefaciens TaxID=453960 RepID=A0A2T2XDR3_9FIRM|nr:MAG: hypothetical protein C7B46_13595 [Sulfobacillus benefaciens]
MTPYMQRHAVSLQTFALGALAILLVGLSLLGIGTWAAFYQWQHMTQFSLAVTQTTDALTSAFDRYDGALNMYVGLDPDSGASAPLLRMTQAQVSQFHHAFVATYHQSLILTRGASLQSAVLPIGSAFARYQHDATAVILDMQHQHYYQALHIQEVGNVATTQAMTTALAQLQAHTTAYVRSQTAHLHILLLEMAFLLGALSLIVIGTLGVGLAVIRRTTRELVRDLQAFPHGHFTPVPAPTVWKEYALIRTAFGEMQDALSASFMSFLMLIQHQEALIQARTQRLQHDATRIRDVLRMTALTMQDWHQDDILERISHEFLRTVQASGWVSLAVDSHQENARRGDVPWDEDNPPKNLQMVIGTPPPSSPGCDPHPFPITTRLVGQLCGCRPYGLGRSLLVILRDVRDPWPESEQMVTELAIVQIQHLLSAVLLFRETLRQAEQDGLTGLQNRRVFERILEQDIQAARVHGRSFQLVVLDLDHLKTINDSLGHLAGDHALTTLGNALRQVSTEQVSVFRIGGDEFGILLHDAYPFTVQDLLQSIQTMLPPSLTISAGVARCPTLGTSARMLFMAADWALYEAKMRGRDQWASASVMEMLARLGQPGDMDTINVLVALLDDRLAQPTDTTRTMVAWARTLAQDLGCSPEDQQVIELAALLHDLGRLAGNHSPLPRTAGESAAIAADFLAVYPLLTEVAHAIRFWAAWWDGRGSSTGLKGLEIPLASRIIAVVDQYGRCRCASPSSTPPRIAAVLEAGAGTRLDPDLVWRFVQRLQHLPEEQEQGLGS